LINKRIALKCCDFTHNIEMSAAICLTRWSCRQRIVAGCGYVCLLEVAMRSLALLYLQQVVAHETTYSQQTHTLYRRCSQARLSHDIMLYFT